MCSSFCRRVTETLFRLPENRKRVEINREIEFFRGARSFLILPLIAEGKLLGLIYGDYSEARASAPSGLAEGPMLDWRDQLLHALRSGATKQP